MAYGGRKLGEKMLKHRQRDFSLAGIPKLPVWDCYGEESCKDYGDAFMLTWERSLSIVE